MVDYGSFYHFIFILLYTGEKVKFRVFFKGLHDTAPFAERAD